MSTAEERLHQSLVPHFSQDAADLARLFTVCLPNECTAYADIDLPLEAKNEGLLTAFEERALIPVQNRPSPSWSACGLRLTPDETYFFPRVVRILLQKAQEEGSLAPEQAVLDVLTACSNRDPAPMASLLALIKNHARSFKVEAGLLHNLIQAQELDLDLHATMDLYVLAGLMSPWTGSSVASGLAWFEVNPCLFWEQ